MQIKFIDYTGEYPNLCTGILTLEVDGVIYKFTYDYKTRRTKEPDVNWFDSFWRSGGCVHADEEWNFTVYEGSWELSSGLRDVPEFFEEHREEFIEIFNENVPYGCCGGCI